MIPRRLKTKRNKHSAWVRKQATLSGKEMNEICVNMEHPFMTPPEHTKVICKTTMFIKPTTNRCT